MNATDARAQWSRLLNDVFRGNTRVIVEKSGVPVAALISAEDLVRFERCEHQRAERFKVTDRVRAAFADVPDEELERQIEKALAAARAELRAEREQAVRR